MKRQRAIIYILSLQIVLENAIENTYGLKLYNDSFYVNTPLGILFIAKNRKLSLHPLG